VLQEVSLLLLFQRSRCFVAKLASGIAVADGQFHRGQYTPLELSRQESEFCMDTPSAREGPLVLMIDDSRTTRKILEVCLEREGYSVVSYGDPLEALRALNVPNAAIPDIAFIDIGLPGMNGYQVIQYLKVRPQFQQMTIIVLSGRNGLLDRLKARLAGATEYVTKPFKTQEIVALVQKYAPYNSEGNQGT
jgi:CheY-like chemotaxis protein